MFQGISFNLVALLYLVHFSIPGAEQHTTKFFTLSYFNSNTGKYGAGQDDICFISFCIVLFTGLRAGSMKYTLDPLARWWGISKGKDITRFSEQSWNLLCYSTFCPLSIVSPILCPFSASCSYFAVHLPPILTLSQHARTLDRLAPTRSRWTHESIYSSRVIILHPTTRDSQHRRSPERSLADAHTPPRDNSTHIRIVRVSSDKSWPSDLDVDGCN